MDASVNANAVNATGPAGSPAKIGGPAADSPSKRAKTSPSKMGQRSPAKSPLAAAQEASQYAGFADIKSSCGEQVDSRKTTAPCAVFGSSTRPRTTSSGNKSPGPGAYQVPSSIGKPVLSTMVQAPACSISGREKFGSTTDLKGACKTPGPGDYTSKVINPREQTAPKFSLGKKWTSLSEIKKSPGPGAYEAPTTIGGTVLSTQKSNPASSFPKVERKPLMQTQTGEVGPGQYGTVLASVGKQPVSTLSNAAAFTFGTEQRNKPAGRKGFQDSVPGPNSYGIHSSMGKQAESVFRTAPKVSMSGRTKFGSHF